MANYYGFVDKMKAINILDAHKGKVITTIVNLENGVNECNRISKEKGKEMIRAVQSIVLDNDEFIPHLMCYTYAQSDVKHIIRKGILYDILL